MRKEQEPWEKALSLLLKLEKPQQKLGIYLKILEHDSTARAYVLNVIKHRRCFDNFLQTHLKRHPQPALKCFLKLVMGQLWQIFSQKEGSSPWAPLINGWIERAKRRFSYPECRCINAVLHKVLPYFQQFSQWPLSIRYNTPEFLLERYQKFYGESALLAFLEWNDGFAQTFIHTDTPDPCLQSTEWPGFYTLKQHQDWPKIFEKVKHGLAYIQDPMTRIPVEYLEVKPGQCVLDLCAAPGGKTVQIAQQLKNTGSVIAVDLPERIKLLQDNLRFYPNVQIHVQDILSLTPECFHGLTFDRILLDAPCSNTGVIRRKPDVVDRLHPQDFQVLPGQQYRMLKKASEFLSPKGLLVYSTCSIDPDENEGVVQQFLKTVPGFTLKKSHISLPWIDHHDGGGCFCLQREQK